jgi:Trypsin
MSPSLKLGNVVVSLTINVGVPQGRTSLLVGHWSVPFLGILAWAAFCMANPLTASAAVIGADDRQAVPANLFELNAKIGLLVNSRSRAVCTAFCIETDLIATAAHCIYPMAGAALGSDITFQLRGATSRVRNSDGPVPAVITGSLSVKLSPPIDAVSDWAIIKLASPTCKAGGLALSTLSAVDLETQSPAPAVYNASFHRDQGDGQLLLSRNCSVSKSFRGADATVITREFSDAANILLHTCDTGLASSGSPLLIDGPEGPEVIGINSGTYVRTRTSVKNQTLAPRYRTDVIANTGVSVSRFLDQIENLNRADLIASKADLDELRDLLAAEGLLSGQRDRALDTAALKHAIEAFERSTGQPVQGLATTVVLERLRERRAAPSQIETGSVRHHMR